MVTAAELVARRLAPLHIITTDEPARLEDWLPRITLDQQHTTPAGRTTVTITIHHHTLPQAEQGAATIFRMLNGWDPPGPWHRVTAAITTIDPDRPATCTSCARAAVTATTRWEGAGPCPRG